MRISDLQYVLPPDRIAQQPVEPRDAARLLVMDRAGGTIAHRRFRDLPEYLRPEDCLVINRTQVIPAQFFVRRKSGGRLEGLFLTEPRPGQWEVMLRGVGRIRPGETLELGEGRWAMTLDERLDRGRCRVRIDPPQPALEILEAAGRTPLPPYIRREQDGTGPGGPGADDGIDARDRACYQTVYAQTPGAVAAPTAGLHFTPALLDQLRAMGIGIADVTLHVGAGTFQPIEVEDLGQHRMHAEWYELPPEAAELIRTRRAAGGRIVAVGTTSVRVLESCASETGEIKTGSGWTDLLIYPPYEFKAVDALITNFHLPGSTLLALVMAFAGRENMLAAYQTAIEKEYRFYSYGDAMLIMG